jgi:hypothetical protein
MHPFAAAAALLLIAGPAFSQEFPSLRAAAETRLPRLRAPPSTVACQNGSARLRRGEPPLPAPALSFVAPVGPMPRAAPEYAFTFDVTAEGRPVSIRRASTAERPFLPNVDAVAADLALYVFEPSATALRAARSASRSGPSPQLSSRRLSPGASPRRCPRGPPPPGCANWAPPRVRTANGAPSGRECAITRSGRRPRRPGGLDGVQVRFDVDAGRETVGVAVEGSSGKRRAERRGHARGRRIRLFPEPAKGCWAQLGLTPVNLPAPTKPPTASFQKPGDTCRSSDVAKALEDAARYYPEPFRRRNIEAGPWSASTSRHGAPSGRCRSSPPSRRSFRRRRRAARQDRQVPGRRRRRGLRHARQLQNRGFENEPSDRTGALDD